MIVLLCLFLMNNYNDSEFVNVGSGVEFSIKEVGINTR